MGSTTRMQSVLFLLVLTMALASAFVAKGPRGAQQNLSRRALTLSAASKDADAAPKATKKASKAKKAATDKAPAPETFKKAEFIMSLSEKTGMNKKESEEAMQAVFDVIQEQVAAGKKVNLAGFGTFTCKDRAARKGRNPQTGEELQIAASKAPGFSAAKAWKDTLNGRA
jgi:DNA-binding protein HU-beta